MSTRHRKYSDHPELRKILGLRPAEPVPDLSLLANAENEATGEAFEVYAFKKLNGGYGLARIPREQSLFDDRSTARTIAARNGDLPRDLKKALKLVRKASRAGPRRQWRYVKQDGWRGGMRAFAHRGRIYGRKRVGSVELKGPLSDRTRNYPLGRKGDLEEWKRIAGLARYSTRLRMCICAAFAAPLLKTIDLQAFIIVLAGPSKAGKSTALLAAASVIGIGREGSLPNFNATTASLQETATEFNDRLLPVNEIGLLKGAKRDFYQNLRTLIYRYAEGRDTGRHSKSQYAIDAGVAEWRGIMIASSENTFEALAELAGEKRDEGEYARAFDVPATRPGNPTVFDSFPRGLKPEEREAWARRELATIRQLSAEQYGVAFVPYITSLIRERATLKREVRSAMRRFMDSLEGAVGSGAMQHAAQNFAILYAGAVMAQKAGLLPWNLARTRADLKTCFIDGRQEISRVEGAEDRALKTILSRIGSLKALTDETAPKAVDGWFTKTPRGRLYAVRTPSFENWFLGPEEERAAIRWLHKQQLLTLKDGAKPDFANKGWAVTFPKVEGKGQRCFQFLDPRGKIEQAASRR